MAIPSRETGSRSMPSGPTKAGRMNDAMIPAIPMVVTVIDSHRAPGRILVSVLRRRSERASVHSFSSLRRFPVGFRERSEMSSSVDLGKRNSRNSMSRELASFTSRNLTRKSLGLDTGPTA
jgi:hypothetical protein